MVDMTFYENKRVFITGHTGFKGSWLCRILLNFGAKICGYALMPPTDPSLFEMLNIADNIMSVNGDVKDLTHISSTMKGFRPEIVIHMAAQPLVRLSYSMPVSTYETNVMGTVNVLEAVRSCPSVKSFLNVTTDKVYKNHEWHYGYREIDELCGYDPYSNSKSCSELVTYSYYNSFFKDSNVAVSTARAGNVIGGGDFSGDRIIPDCVRAIIEDKKIIVRNPYSIRPYQHVLEPLFAYLMTLKEQYSNKALEGAYNIGPDENDCITTGEIVSMFCKEYGSGIEWVNMSDGGPHESGLLKLDCSKFKSVFGWKPKWNIREAVRKAAEWSRAYIQGSDIKTLTDKHIISYYNDEVKD